VHAHKAPLVVTGTPGRVTVGFGADRADPGGYGAVMAADQVAVLGGGDVLLADSDRLGHNELDLVALRSDGSLDKHFGAGGVVRLQGLGLYAPVKIAPEADGGALVLAVNQNNVNGPSPMALVRVSVRGALDGAFAGGGVDRPAGLSGPADIALEADGSVALASTTGSNTTSPRVLVTRLSAQGSPIAAFGSGGTTQLPQTDEQAVALALAPDGDIVVLGNPVVLGKPMMLAALTQAGALDPAFNGGAPVITGQVASSSAPQSADQQLLVQPSGTIELLYSPTSSAFGEPSVSHELFIAAYSPAGAIDAGFGNAGTLKLALGENAGLPSGEAPGAQASLLPAAGGDTLVLVPTASDAPEVIRLLANGQPDPALGGAGGQIIKLVFGGLTMGEAGTGPGADFGESAAETANGTIYLPGTVELAFFNGGGTGFSNTFVTHDAVAALTASLQRDTAFGAHGANLRVRTRVIGVRGSSVLVQLSPSQAAAVSAKVTAGSTVIAQSRQILLYDEKPTAHGLALTPSGKRRLQGGSRIHVKLAVTATALDGQTRTFHASATIE
jgi:uncharacterized delta-60 repeat protein